ncbi:hypothetical protein [Phytohabitans houttuyneae]|nr:hypothetical protein [Phytohabitans houttuyneae]
MVALPSSPAARSSGGPVVVPSSSQGDQPVAPPVSALRGPTGLGTSAARPFARPASRA